MKKQIAKNSMIKTLIILLLAILSVNSYSQDKLLDDFHASVGVTNNGISVIPSFSLGAPAGSLQLDLRKGKFSFEPDLKFSLVGKPWSFIFWFRYKTINSKKFNLRLGAYPAILFPSMSILENGTTRNVIQAQRYVACEVVPYYKLNENLSVGAYYLYSRGFDGKLINTHFFAGTLNYNLILNKDKNYYLGLSTQLYNLNMDNVDGTFIAEFITLGKKGFPITLRSTLNKKIDSNIPAQDFNWNLSVFYSF